MTSEHRALHGIVHSAGLLRDGLLASKSIADFDAVLAPKVQGLLNLDEATRDLALECFVCFSSISAVLDSATFPMTAPFQGERTSMAGAAAAARHAPPTRFWQIFGAPWAAASGFWVMTGCLDEVVGRMTKDRRRRRTTEDG